LSPSTALGRTRCWGFASANLKIPRRTTGGMPIVVGQNALKFLEKSRIGVLLAPSARACRPPAGGPRTQFSNRNKLREKQNGWARAPSRCSLLQARSGFSSRCSAINDRRPARFQLPRRWISPIHAWLYSSQSQTAYSSGECSPQNQHSLDRQLERARKSTLFEQLRQVLTGIGDAF